MAVNMLLRTIRFTILLVRKGEVKIQMDSEIFLLQARELMIVPENISCAITGINDRSYIGVLSFTRAFAFGNTMNRFQPVFFIFLMARKPPVIWLKHENICLLFLLMALLDVKIKNTGNPGPHDEVLQLGFHLLLLELRNLYQNNSKDIVVDYTGKHTLVIHFFEALHLYYKTRHKIQFYADSLHVTVDHLRKTVKEVTDKPAKYFIKEILLREAGILLLEHINITTISQILGFNSIYHFSNFFKKHTSMSPTAYRKRLHTKGTL